MTISNYLPTQIFSAYNFEEDVYDACLPKRAVKRQTIQPKRSDSSSVRAHKPEMESTIPYEALPKPLSRSISVSMLEVIQKNNDLKAHEVKTEIEKLGFIKPSPMLFDLLAERNPELLLDVIEFYVMSPVDLAYAFKAVENIESPSIRAYRVVLQGLEHDKGYVREGASYGILAFRHSKFASRAVEALESAVPEEKFDSVKRVFASVIKKLKK